MVGFRARRSIDYQLPRWDTAAQAAWRAGLGLSYTISITKRFCFVQKPSKLSDCVRRKDDIVAVLPCYLTAAEKVVDPPLTCVFASRSFVYQVGFGDYLIIREPYKQA